MLCPNCQHDGVGNFCAQCGAVLTTADDDIPACPVAWQYETRYDELMKFPEVRVLVEASAATAKRVLPAETLLKLYDLAFASMNGVSLEKLAPISQSVNEWLGLKTGATRQETLRQPVGEVIVGVVCALIRHGCALGKVRDDPAGCVLEADVPSDLWSFKGGVKVTVTADSTVTAQVTIKGQMYDWGKSKRLLAHLFDDLHATPALLVRTGSAA